MIYILVGDDVKNKSIYIKELTDGRESSFIFNNDADKNLIMSYVSDTNLFGANPVIVLENILNEGIISFSSEELDLLKDSDTPFIFKEDKFLSTEQKKYKKYGEIKIFENKKMPVSYKFNIFGITDAFAKHDKVMTWVLYRRGIEGGVEPEAIAGILFWKIKTMILSGNYLFDKDELKRQSSRIVSIYHKAHRGESDFSIGLEQFILSSLSSK